MSSLTHLCFNRLEAEPYLHRLVPHLSSFIKEHPDQRLIVISDKKLFSTALYLSLSEAQVTTTLYNQYHLMPCNLFQGSSTDVLKRLERLDVSIFSNQMTYEAISKGLTVIKQLRSQQAGLTDLISLLNDTDTQGHRMIAAFQKIIAPHHLKEQQIAQWFLNDYFQKNDQYTATMSTRLQLHQLEQSFKQCFTQTHSPEDLIKNKVTIIDIEHLTYYKKQVMLYLLELFATLSQQHPNISVILDLSLVIPDEDWLNLLLNNQLEVTQIRHVVKENELVNSHYPTRSIKHFRYYAITNKHDVLKLIQQFKCPYQIQTEETVLPERDEGPLATSNNMSLYDVVDFEF